MAGSEDGTSDADPVRVWLVVLPGDEDAVRPLADLLDAEERERAARLRHARDRARFVGAHAARRLVLAAALGTDPAGLAFGRDPCPLCAQAHGRPHVRGVDRPVSLSHTAGLAAVALAPAGLAVGVDAEATRTRVDADDLLGALHPREAAGLAALPAGGRAAAALRLWVRKESYLKGIGTGLGLDPATVQLGPDTPNWTVVDLDAGPAHLAAVAVATACPPPIEVERLALPRATERR